ncbi:hypothetical protein RD792_011191 [Penstemon davidsonii]|uniref:Alliinase C-terminal domain-containing protein n=1 Tax=Penstemon davidsonii TaxID=160366 RepID=A0ABR0D3W5_9LAMI|nr:hypothetical protein RD792_011191 [Penstemon davidsonii]
MTPKEVKLVNLDKVARFIMVKALDKERFQKIKHFKIAKEMWDKVCELREGNDAIKEHQLSVTLEKFENFKMKSGETIEQMDTRFTKILNEVLRLSKKFSDKEITMKVRKALPPKFNMKVTAMEESRDLGKISFSELFSSLKAYEYKLPRMGIDESSGSDLTAALIASDKSRKSADKSKEKTLHASTGAVLLSGWHRMGYSFNDKFAVSPEHVNNIHKVHAIARNAITKGKYIVFGGGSTQLLGAAVYALSMNLSDYFQNMHFEFKGDALTLNNSSDNLENVIEFVTSPNNPDGNMRRAVAQGKSVKAIYDHAYYWPHFTAIPSPANEDVMVFTISKLIGHAGSRFGEKDNNCNAVLQAGKIIGRSGSLFDSEDRYVRLSLLMRDDDFKLLLHRLNILVANEDGAKTI